MDFQQLYGAVQKSVCVEVCYYLWLCVLGDCKTNSVVISVKDCVVYLHEGVSYDKKVFLPRL